MANINHMNPGRESVSETPSDEFLDQILHFQAGYGYTPADASFHLGNGNMAHLGAGNGGHGATASGGGGGFSLGLSSSLEQGRININGGGTFVASGSGDNHRSNNHLILHSSSLNPGFHGHGQPMTNTTPHPPAIRPRVRARRGQATDPHSIAERLRREKIAERIRALQELIPNVNKTDRAAMLDEVVDYVKFLRLQVKVLSMSRLGGAAAVAPLVTEIPVSSVEDDDSNGGGAQPAWEKWSNDGTERQVAKLMEENIGAALQLLQSKALCIMPLSLASAIYLAPPPDSSIIMEPESDPTPQSSNVQP